MRNWGSLHMPRVMKESEVELNLLHTDCSDVSSLMFAHILPVVYGVLGEETPWGTEHPFSTKCRTHKENKHRERCEKNR